MLRPLLCSLLLAGSTAQAADWPQWLGPQRDGAWREEGILKTFPATGPKVVWRTPIAAGYAGPAVANGKVYVCDRALAEGTANPTDQFKRGEIPGKERILCLNEADGKILWKVEYDCPYTISYAAGPRTTPVVADGKVYTLGAEGDLYCVNAEDGKVVWQKNFKKEYNVTSPTWGFSSSPLVDGNKIFCIARGNGTTAVAFDKDTGKEIWRALNANEIGYSPPVMIEHAGKRQLLMWTGEAMNSLNPETGEVYWSQIFRVRMGLNAAMARKDGDILFLTTFYDGAMALKLDSEKPGASVLWRAKSKNEKDTDTLNSIIPTPWVENGYVYGVCSYGELRCLKLATGERVWESLEATGGKKERWANAFLVKHGERFFLANEHGDLIIAELSPTGYKEISRTHLLEPTGRATGAGAARDVVWSHPAFANKRVYMRNDKEIIAVDLSAAQ